MLSAASSSEAPLDRLIEPVRRIVMALGVLGWAFSGSGYGERCIAYRASSQG